MVETDNRKNFLKEKLYDFIKETNSKKGRKILNDYENEIKKFIQVCPIEMLDKLEEPISFNLKKKIS